MYLFYLISVYYTIPICPKWGFDWLYFHIFQSAWGIDYFVYLKKMMENLNSIRPLPTTIVKGIAHVSV